MNKLLVSSLLAGCLCAPAFATVIYGAGDNNSLYTIDPTTGTTTRIGVAGALGTTMYDIADYAGNLYGIGGNGNFYSINSSTGVAHDVGSDGLSSNDFLNSLTFGPNGTLYGSGPNDSKLYTINVGTGSATAIAGETNSTPYNSAGDLEYLNGLLYLTVQTSGNSLLYTVNIGTGTLSRVGTTTNLGAPNVYGLAYDTTNSTLYGFSDNDGSSKVITINTGTGAGTVGASYGGTGDNAFGFNGATDNNETPEPGTLGAMGLGLLGLGSFAYRRRKA